jgi:hypothetical protein
VAVNSFWIFEAHMISQLIPSIVKLAVSTFPVAAKVLASVGVVVVSAVVVLSLQLVNSIAENAKIKSDFFISI